MWLVLQPSCVHNDGDTPLVWVTLLREAQIPGLMFPGTRIQGPSEEQHLKGKKNPQNSPLSHVYRLVAKPADLVSQDLRGPQFSVPINIHKPPVKTSLNFTIPVISQKGIPQLDCTP